MTSAATVWIDILGRDDDFQAALANTQAGMEAVRVSQAETAGATGSMLAAMGWKDEAAKVGEYTTALARTGEQAGITTEQTNNLSGGIFRLNTITMLVGRSLGMTSEQLQVMNMGMLALSGRANLLSAGGMAKLLAIFTSLGPVGWGSIAVIAAMGTSLILHQKHIAAAAKETKEYTEFLEKFTAIMKSANDAMYGGEPAKVSGIKGQIDELKKFTKEYEDSTVRIKQLQEALANQPAAKTGSYDFERQAKMRKELAGLEGSLPTGDEKNKLDAAIARRQEAEKLLDIVNILAPAEQGAAIKLLELELGTSAAYKKSNDFLRDKIGLNTDRIAAINEEQAAIVGLGGEEKRNSTEYISLQQKKLEIQNQNADLFNEITDKNQKAAEAAAAAEKLNQEYESGPYEETRKGIKSITDALQEQIDTLGMTSDELQIYKATQAGATEGELDKIKAKQKEKNDKQTEIDGTNAVTGAVEKQTEAVKELQKFQSILIGPEELWERIQTGLASGASAAGASAGGVSSGGSSSTPADINTGEINRNTSNTNTLLGKVVELLQDIKRTGFIANYN
jgi:hypothetical protein